MQEGEYLGRLVASLGSEVFVELFLEECPGEIGGPGFRGALQGCPCYTQSRIAHILFGQDFQHFALIFGSQGTHIGDLFVEVLGYIVKMDPLPHGRR